MIMMYLIFFQRQRNQRQAVVELHRQDTREQVNLLNAEILDEKNKIEAFRKKITDFLQLKYLTERLSSSLTLEETSKTLSVEVSKLLGEETTIILYLFYPETRELGISASHKRHQVINLKSKKEIFLINGLSEICRVCRLKIRAPIIVLISTAFPGTRRGR